MGWLEDTQKKYKLQAPTGSIVSGSQVSNGTGWVESVAQKKPQQVYSQYQPKKIATTPVKIVQPQKKQPTIVDQAKAFVAKVPLGVNIPQSISNIVKSVDFERVKQAFSSGVKSLPGTVKIAGGIIAESWGKQQKEMNNFFGILPPTLKPFFGDYLTRPFYEQAADKTLVEGPKIREQGKIDQNKAIESYRKLGPAKNQTQQIAEALAFNLPQMALSTGLTVATGLVTKNPQLATAVGFSTSYGLGASEVYTEARNNGLTDKQSMPYAMAGGAIIGAIDFLPLARLIRKTGAVEPVKQSIIKKISSEIVSVGLQSGFEGITEGAQEIIGNAIRATYSDNKNLFENVGLSTVVGALFGGGTDVVVGGISSVGGKKSVEQITEEVNNKIEKVLNKPDSKRTVEEKALVQELLTKTFTPDEALSIVMENDLQNTKEGKEIIKAVAQAKPEGKEIRITSNEDRDIETIEIVSPEGFEKGVNFGDDMIAEPEEFTYEQAQDLNEDERKVESKMGEKIASDQEGMIAQYQEKFGNVLNTDNARELSDDYSSSNEARSTYSAAVHEPSSQLVKNIYKKMLAMPAEEGKMDAVLFTGGGTGAGKSSGIKNIADIDNYHIVYDTNMNSFDSAKEKIDMALEANKDVDIIYVYRDPIEAMQNGALPRAMRIGRTVPIDEHIKTHLGAAETALRLVEEYKGDDRVMFQFIDNSNGKGNQEISSIDVFKKKIYNKDELKAKLVDLLENEYKSGKISRKVYEGTIRKQKSESKESSEKNSTVNGKKSSQDQVNPSGSRRNIVSTKESKAIKDALVNRFLELGQISETPQEYSSNIKDSINNAMDRAKGDKVVLSAIRAAINDEMVRISGASKSESYKAQYAQIMQAMKDEFIGPALEFMDQIKADIDEKLTTAREVPTVIEKVVNLKNKEQKTVSSKEIPVGEGKAKRSRLFERIKETIGIDLEGEGIPYSQLSLNEQAEKVATLIENDPEKAVKIARGFIEPPSGMTQNAVAVGLAESARLSGDYQTAADLWTKTSLRSTRLGQEIVSLRGDFVGNESLNAVKQVVEARVERILNRYSDVVKGLSLSEDASSSRKVDALVKHEAKKVKKVISKQEKSIQSAQEIINAITCKV